MSFYGAYSIGSSPSPLEAFHWDGYEPSKIYEGREVL